MATNHPRVLWTVLCKSATVDQESNNISLYSVLERITFTKHADAPQPEGPAAIALESEFVVLMQRPDPDDDAQKVTYAITVRITDPAGATLSEFPVPAIFDAGKKRLRLKMRNDAFLITTSGQYTFSVTDDESGTELSTLPIEVIVS